MVKIVEYGTTIIDITDAMIEHRKGLSKQHLSYLHLMRNCSVRFVTGCFRHEHADLDSLYRFLDGDAIRLIKIVLGCIDQVVSDKRLHPVYREAAQRIKDCGLAIRTELIDMKFDLLNFMEEIGLPAPDAKHPDVNPRSHQPKDTGRVPVDYTERVLEQPGQQTNQPQTRTIKRLKPRENQVQSQQSTTAIRRIKSVPKPEPGKIRRLVSPHQ